MLPVIEIVIGRIHRMAKGKPFHRKVFTAMGSQSAVSRALSALVRAGKLERLARGVYMRPKWEQYIGQVHPGPVEVVNVIAKANGETLQIHGAEAVRRFGLSTQMQILPVYYTSGYSRELKVGNGTVRLRHVSKRRLQHAGTKVGLAITALYYIGQKDISDFDVNKICSALTSDELSTLMNSIMPRWMALALIRFSDHSSKG